MGFSGGREWLKEFPIETNTSQPDEPATKNSAFQWRMDQTGVRKLNSSWVFCLAHQSTRVREDTHTFHGNIYTFPHIGIGHYKVLNF